MLCCITPAWASRAGPAMAEDALYPAFGAVLALVKDALRVYVLFRVFVFLLGFGCMRKRPQHANCCVDKLFFTSNRMS